MLPVLALSGLVLVGCGHSGTGPATTVQVTTTHTVSTPAPASATAAIDPGPVTSASGNCPIIDEPTAADALGIRMGAQSVQSAGSTVVGCEFFPTTDPAFVASEHLPGPNQPVLQITSSRYPTPGAAHNAMVAIGTAGGSAHSAGITGGITGISYQTTFDPSDGAQDWAFVFATGSTVVTVLTAQSDVELNARTVAGEIATKF
jgi:hypothetical protein